MQIARLRLRAPLLLVATALAALCLASPAAAEEPFEVGPQSGPTSDPGALASKYFHSDAQAHAPASLGSLLSRGVQFDAFCSEDCEARVRLVLDSGAAQRSNLPSLLGARSFRLKGGVEDSFSVRTRSGLRAGLRSAGIDPGDVTAKVTFRRA